MSEGDAVPEKKDGWYVSRGGQTFGPVAFDQVIEAAKAGRLEPRTDMLFGGDLADWVPAGEVEGVFERVDPEEAAAEAVQKAEAGNDPHLADVGDFEEEEDEPTKLDLPGAHRLGYFFGVTLLPTILIIALSKMMPVMIEVAGPKYGGYVPYIIFVVPLVVLIVTVKRFQNLAMSGWWWLGLGVPILQIWLYFRLFACPPGYAYTKKLDLAGKILTTIYVLSLVGSIALGVLFGALVVKKSGEEEFQERLQQIRNEVDDWMFQAKQQEKEAEQE